MYADEMQTQMDYEAQMAEQEMYESQMYADMQQESASYTQADVHDSDWHIADDRKMPRTKTWSVMALVAIWSRGARLMLIHRKAQ